MVPAKQTKNSQPQDAGFQIVRNAGSSWHRNSDWLPPYQDIRGLKFSNAFWERRFSLIESEYCRIGWEKSLQILEKEVRRIGVVVDSAVGAAYL